MSLLIGIPSLQNAWLLSHINCTSDVHTLTAPLKWGGSRHVTRVPSIALLRGAGAPARCHSGSRSLGSFHLIPP